MARSIRRLARIVLALGMAATLFFVVGAPASARPNPSSATHNGASSPNNSQNENDAAITSTTKLTDPDT
ncbi:MAG TPA: hypothetical protein K8W21_04000, partial [Enorma massiliensis]|uniref:hypothetical protein n=1 Tax=Enorma massiliensis TaxID=1472761 RepID=UPI001D419F9D